MIGSRPTQVVLGHFPQSPFFRSKSGFAVGLGCDLPSVPECTSPCKLFKPSGLFPRTSTDHTLVNANDSPLPIMSATDPTPVTTLLCATRAWSSQTSQGA